MKAKHDFADAKWDEVVGYVDVNWASLGQFFGPRILRTIEASGHPSPERTYRDVSRMFVSQPAMPRGLDGQ